MAWDAVKTGLLHWPGLAGRDGKGLDVPEPMGAPRQAAAHLGKTI